MSYEGEFEDRITTFLKRLQRGKELEEGEAQKGREGSAGHRAWKAAGRAEPDGSGPGLFGESRPYFWRQEEVFQNAVVKFAFYLQLEREHYLPAAVPLPAEHRPALEGFYSGELLDRVRIVYPTGQRVGNPWFYPEARAAGLSNLPDITHKANVTFLDVIVFNEPVTHRDLFHGLVHVAQLEILGVERFAELFVRGFLQARSYFLVPLKAHAFALDARFASAGEARFSVEQEVRRWAEDGRY